MILMICLSSPNRSEVQISYPTDHLFGFNHYKFAMTVKNLDLFFNILREVRSYSPVEHHNNPTVIQSSVGLIFKALSTSPATSLERLFENDVTNVELLFTQRAGFESDSNAYNVVFPGGQCDNDESDLQACKRELFEQVGIKVDSQCFYVGKIPCNFHYVAKRNKQVYISCHIWVLRHEHINFEPTLNPAELRDYKWVHFDQLLEARNYQITNMKTWGVLDRITFKPFALSVRTNLISAGIPSLNLGMQRTLWGLTLWIWSYVLQMGVAEMPLCARRTKVEQIIGSMGNLQLQFKGFYPLKYPILLGSRCWIYFRRVRQFTYRRRKNTLLAYAGLIMVMMVIMFILIG